MGGVQSQESCSKDSPKYSYHERVLQEVEAAFLDDNMAPAEAFQGDEQFYSADEGDSVCSLTPERTRPESSSAENSSFTSEDHKSDDDGDVDSIDEDTSRDESSVNENEFLMSVDSLPNVNVGSEASRGNNHFNVWGQEHVQQTSKCKIHENNLVRLENKCRPGQITGCCNKGITSYQKGFTQSTGEASATSQELHLVKNGPGSDQHVANCDMSSEHENNFLSPLNIRSATNSFKRKRSRYPESSESESDCGRKEGHVNILKKRQKSKHHNRSRRIHRSSRFRRDSASDSDESERGGANHCKRCACNSKNEGYTSERECVNQKCTKQFCQKNVDGYICDKNIADSADTSCCCSMKNFQRPAVESSFADKIDSRQGSKCVHNCNHESNDCVNGQQTRQHGTVPNFTEVKECDVYTGPLRDNVFSQNGNILTEEQRLTNGQDISSNIRSKEQCSHTVEQLLHAPLHQKHQSGKDTFENAAVLLGQSSNRDRQSASDKDFGVFLSLQKNTDLSTLTNVSAPKRMDSACAQQPETFHKAGSSCVSEPIIQNTPNNSFWQNRQHGCQNKKEKTAADKFMHLFSAAKKEIGSNIKSLFSKVTVTDTFSSKPNWQTYLSESSSASKACIGVRRRQEDYTASSTMDGRTAQVNSPLINREHPHKPQSTIGSRILDSPSYSSNGESLVTPSLAAPNNCLYVGSRSPPVTAHSMSLRGSKQSLNIKSPSADSLNKRGQFRSPSDNSVHPLNKDGQSPSQSDTCSVEWLPQDTDHQVLNCSLAGALCVSVSVGELGEQKTSGIVNWTDGALTHKVTRCSRSIASKAGALMWASCVDYIENKGSDLEAPDVLTTPAGGRFDKSVVAILHVVEPRLVGEDEGSNATALVEVYTNCLRFANERLGLDSLSFPLIGDGTFPFDICLRSFFDALLVFLAEQTSSEHCDLTKVQLIIPDINSASFAADLIHSHLQNIISNDLYCVARDTFNHHFGGKHKV